MQARRRLPHTIVVQAETEDRELATKFKISKITTR